MITIREIREHDARDFLELCRRLDEETQFMMLEPGERLTTEAEQRERIKKILSEDNQTILVAESEGRLVGCAAGLGGSYRRNRHSVHVVIGILQAFAGQGSGTKLLGELEKWACGRKMHRLELTVMVHNERAFGLYKKLGFAVEGTRRDSLFVNDAYVDEYTMAKMLS